MKIANWFALRCYSGLMNPIVNVRMPSEINLWVRQLAFRRRRTVTDVVVAALALARDVLESQEALEPDEEETNAAVDRFLTRVKPREEPVGSPISVGPRG